MQSGLVTELDGRVVILNGASSAGKSSVATALQSRWVCQDQCWVIVGWDDFVPRLPDRWRSVPDAVGDRGSDGVAYRLVSRPSEALRAVLVPGPIGRRMLHAYHRSVAAMASAGVNVLVEEVMISAEEWLDWNEALRGLTVTWVGVRCDEGIAARREATRGDRYEGLARGTSERVHAHATYDVEVDTSTLSVEAVAAAIDTSLHDRR